MKHIVAVAFLVSLLSGCSGTAVKDLVDNTLSNPAFKAIAKMHEGTPCDNFYYSDIHC